MVVFEDIQDVQEWLAPLDYLGFWRAVEPYGLALRDRDHCDRLIAGGFVEADLILRGLKVIAVFELRRAFGLKDRIPEHVDAQYLTSTH